MPKLSQKHRKMLIIGGSGFIGYHLAKLALKKGWKIDSISRKFPKKNRKLSKVKYLICDITKLKNIKKSIKKNYNFVVNLGGDVDHKNKSKTYQSHYIGCKNISNFFLDRKIATFVQIGSSSEYAKSKSPHKESFKCNPKSYYGKSKNLASNYLINLKKNKNFPIIILRLYQTFGSNQDLNRLIPFVIKSCISKKKFPCSDGNQYRDFLIVDQVVKAILKCYRNTKAYGQIINIGSGKARKVKDVIETIKSKIKKGEPQYGMIKLRSEESLKAYPNIQKAKKLLNWEPCGDFKKNLHKTIASYKKNKK